MTVLRHQAPLAVRAMPAWGPLANPRVRDLVVILAAVVVLSASAQISFDAPFSRGASGEIVPITGQTFGVLLIAAALGWRRGVAAVITYLGIGLMGAPIFSAGTSGMLLFTGSTAGFLWGFILTALVVGWLAEHGFDRGPWLTAVLVFGDAITFAIGLPVLQLWLDRHSIPVSVWEAGLWPFIPGDILKILVASVAIPSAWAAVERFSPRGR